MSGNRHFFVSIGLCNARVFANAEFATMQTYVVIPATVQDYRGFGNIAARPGITILPESAPRCCVRARERTTRDATRNHGINVVEQTSAQFLPMVPQLRRKCSRLATVRRKQSGSPLS